MTNATVRKKQVRDETFKLLTQHGARSWKVRFNPRMTSALGRCSPSQQMIEYQPRFMADNPWDEVVMTIRHEVAHALTIGHGHDATWARKCIELGGNGKQFNTTAQLTRKFVGTCPKCDRKIQRDRRNLRQACGKCCDAYAGGKFDAQYKFIWTRNV